MYNILKVPVLTEQFSVKNLLRSHLCTICATKIKHSVNQSKSETGSDVSIQRESQFHLFVILLYLFLCDFV
jgi:uncharacterized protein YaiE (UPF0345 family)